MSNMRSSCSNSCLKEHKFKEHLILLLKKKYYKWNSIIISKNPLKKMTLKILEIMKNMILKIFYLKLKMVEREILKNIINKKYKY